MDLLALILPLLAIQVILLAVALVDLTGRDRRVRGDNKLIWALVIIFISFFGPLIYFLVGREDA